MKLIKINTDKEYQLKRAMYSGSFDPPTNGHLDIIRRASLLTDSLVVAVAKNPRKQQLFTPEERIDMIKNITADLKNVTPVIINGLLADYLKEHNIQVVIRGLRVGAEFDYEFTRAVMSKKLYPKMETIILMTDEKYSFVSSNLMKEVAQFHGDVSAYLPEYVVKKMKEKTG